MEGEGTMYAQLILRSGKHSGRKLAMQRRKILLGSGSDCALRIRGHGVAAHHGALFVSGGVLAVHNLARHGKTYVNDTAVKGTRRLEPGDMLRIGPLTLEVQFDPAALAKTIPVSVPSEEELERRTAASTGANGQSESPNPSAARVVGVCKSREWISGSPSDAAAGALKQLDRRR
jgi:predicted component of type VI protein secretion system